MKTTKKSSKRQVFVPSNEVARMAVPRRSAFDVVVDRMNRVLQDERDEYKTFTSRLQQFGARDALRYGDDLAKAGARADIVRRIAHDVINSERNLEQSVRHAYAYMEELLLTGTSDHSPSSTSMFSNAVAVSTHTAHIWMRRDLGRWLEIFNDERDRAARGEGA